MIFHGANPPGYRNWRGLALPMLNNTDCRRATKRRPHRFSRQRLQLRPRRRLSRAAFEVIAVEHPLTRKGKVRVEMEQLLAAAGKEGIRSLLIRAGDFFGPHQPASWLKDAMIKPGKPLQSIVYPGDFQRRSRMGLSSRSGGNGRTAGEYREIPASFRSFSFWRALARARRSVCGGNPLRLGKSSTADPQIAVDSVLSGRAICNLPQERP